MLAAALDVPGAVQAARLYVTAHGIYVAAAQRPPGRRRAFAPGWTAYEHRLRYQIYDVTDLVPTGENSLDALLGNGWYRGRLGFRFGRPSTGIGSPSSPSWSDHSPTAGDVLATDGSWRARQRHRSPTTSTTARPTDLRRQIALSVTSIRRSTCVPESLDRLVAPDGPPIRDTEVAARPPVWRSPSGRTLVDFGQNLVGWVRLAVRGLGPGTEVTRPARRGARGRRARRRAPCAPPKPPTPTSAPAARSSWSRRSPSTASATPRSTASRRSAAGRRDRRGHRLRSAAHRLVQLPRTPLLNRLHENVVWGDARQLPRRADRLPAARRAARVDRRHPGLRPHRHLPVRHRGVPALRGSPTWPPSSTPDGSVPFVIPDVLHDRDVCPRRPGATRRRWCPGCSTSAPATADVLARQFEHARAGSTRSPTWPAPTGSGTGGFQYGDWLDPTAPQDDPYGAQADPDVVATALLRPLGRRRRRGGATCSASTRTPSATRPGRRGPRRRSSARTSPRPGGIHSDAQTAYALAIQWDLLPDAEAAGRRR